jgi:hypothetical protein
MTKGRTGPDCASTGLARDAFAGVKHSPAFSRLAQRRIAGVVFAARLSMMTNSRSAGTSVSTGPTVSPFLTWRPVPSGSSVTPTPETMTTNDQRERSAAAVPAGGGGTLLASINAKD